VLAEYYAYCDQAKADGWTVVVCTCLPRSDVGAGAGFPARWAAVNADIQANWAAHGAALCDWTTISGMGLITDPAAGVNFQADQLHPNDAGEIKMGTKLTTVLTALL